MSILSLNAQNVNIPDANFKNALLNHYTVIDTNDDGEIQVSEAEAFSGILYVPSNGIDDLTGLNSFINITELNCSSNNLTSLDVSNNTELTELNCAANNLTSLDVSNNTELASLSCGINNLVSLDVSNNTSLTTISCRDNQLTSLDVSNNTALFGLQCFNNNLTSLDVSNNPSLAIVRCENNQLTTLNVTNGNNSGILSFNAKSNNLDCIQIDSGFTPPGSWQKDATAEYSDDCQALSVPSHQQQDVTVYPNPVQDVLHITASEKLKKITIYNLSGQEIAISLNTTSVNMQQMSQGVYLAKIDTANGSIYQKIIKK